jgi:hypothetical protein
LLTGDYTLHLSRVMLALFSGSPYVHPSTASQDEGEIDLRPHLTNTCLQTDAFGAPTPPAELVKLFWELEGLDALSEAGDGKYRSRGKVSRDWLDDTFAKVAKVIAESVKAGVECGSFGLQLVPNAFEVGSTIRLDRLLISRSLGLTSSAHSKRVPVMTCPSQR